MNDKISFIGGDLRIIKLIQMLQSDGKQIYLYGLEKAEELKSKENIIFCGNIKKAIDSSNIVIGPIPFSKDNIKINTPFSKEEITIESLLKNLNNKIFIAGSISDQLLEVFDETTKVIDIMKNEELVILNTIATAEGAIECAISNTDIILHQSKILILGFGRVAKTLAHKLSGLCANVTCCARKEKDLAWIKTYGYNVKNINNLSKDLKEYDIIMNTVPNMILGENELKYVRKDTLLIDLSSKPGGMDEKYIKEYGLNMVWALALPGKVAPKTTAHFIKNTIDKILVEEKINI